MLPLAKSAVRIPSTRCTAVHRFADFDRIVRAGICTDEDCRWACTLVSARATK